MKRLWFSERLRYRLVLSLHTLNVHRFCRRTFVAQADPFAPKSDPFGPPVYVLSGGRPPKEFHG